MPDVTRETLIGIAEQALRADDTAPATVDGLRLRAVLGKHRWNAPYRYGQDGWHIDRKDGSARIILSTANHEGSDWTHASISHTNSTPTYDELALMHKAAFGDGYAYQIFVPPSDHINIHPYALHLWGRADGARVTPDFGIAGTI